MHTRPAGPYLVPDFALDQNSRSELLQFGA